MEMENRKMQMFFLSFYFPFSIMRFPLNCLLLAPTQILRRNAARVVRRDEKFVAPASRSG